MEDEAKACQVVVASSSQTLANPTLSLYFDELAKLGLAPRYASDRSSSDEAMGDYDDSDSDSDSDEFSILSVQSPPSSHDQTFNKQEVLKPAAHAFSGMKTAQSHSVEVDHIFSYQCITLGAT